VNESNIDQFTIGYHYEKALKLKNRYAELLTIDSFQTFPTKAVISYGKAKGI